MAQSCLPCDNNARLGSLPRREAILVDGGWRVAHAFGTALPGWLVAMPLRHVRALHELSEPEAEAMGRVLRRASAALAGVLGCTKSYIMFFAEQQGYEHVHIHVVPRMAQFTPEQTGAGAMSFLVGPGPSEVPENVREELAHRLSAVI